VGDDDDSTANELSQQKKLDEARKQGQRDQQLKELQKKLEKMEKKDGSTTAPSPSGGGSAPPPSATSGPTNCGDGVTAGGNTSCPFAKAVREAYPGSGSTFQVYSSVTDRNYNMACTTTSPHVCRGGNNAAVFFP